VCTCAHCPARHLDSYMKPADLLPFVRDFSSQGDAEGVLRAIDAFSEAFPM